MPQNVASRKQAIDPQCGLRQSDPIYFAVQNPLEGITALEERELNTRRAAVDRQDAGVVGFGRANMRSHGTKAPFSKRVGALPGGAADAERSAGLSSVVGERIRQRCCDGGTENTHQCQAGCRPRTHRDPAPGSLQKRPAMDATRSVSRSSCLLGWSSSTHPPFDSLDRTGRAERNYGRSPSALRP